MKKTFDCSSNYKMWLVLTIAIISGAGPAQAAGFCSTNTISTNSSGMQMTKEPVPLEYGYEDKFKSIHCCARGYRSIEWFKDNVAYPWSAGVSNFIQYPEAANQTLYTQRASRSDGGNYTCRVSNGTHSEHHTINLEILEKAPDTPKTMFISKDQWVEVGSQVRLYCEALVGTSFLADVRSDLHWRRVWPNDTEGPPLHAERKTTREDISDIIGSYLELDRVSAADYGTYVCVVSSNDFESKNYVTLHYKTGFGREPRVSWRALAVWASVSSAGVLALLAAWRHAAPRLRLALRAHRQRRCTDLCRDVLSKEFDVMLCCARSDAPLARQLAAILAHDYRYRVLPLQLHDDPNTWPSLVSSQTSRARSALWLCERPADVAHALAPLQHNVILYKQELPSAKSVPCPLPAPCRTLRMRRPPLRARFWLELRLALPPAPADLRIAEVKIVQDTSTARSNSLTALV